MLKRIDWTPELFLKRVGGGCAEYADKFETLDEVFSLDKVNYFDEDGIVNGKIVPNEGKGCSLHTKKVYF